VRAQVGELRGVQGKAIFEPWKNGIEGYPHPVVEHAFARQRALETFKAARD
jgi:deoxyribodipyrimidine photo-lyase